MARISEREYFDNKLSRLEDHIMIINQNLAIAVEALEYIAQESNDPRGSDTAHEALQKIKSND